MDALRHQLTVACGPPEAFDLFTTAMGTWWDPELTIDAATYSGIEVVPDVGGDVTMLHGAARHRFGQVTAWAPAQHYAQTFWLLMSPDHPTHLDVRFAADDGVCTLHVEHGGWNVDNRGARGRYDAWPVLLGRFARAAARLS